MLSLTSLYWQYACKNILSRFVADYSDICDLLNIREKYSNSVDIMKDITEIASGLSDPHKYGETVAIIQFGADDKIVYKPKSVKAEQGLHGFVTWLNSRLDISLNLECLPVIDKGSYGWSKFIKYTECENDDEIRKFYYRIGMFSAIFYVLRGMDYHHENLIAHRDHPYFIDHEMLFYPIYVNQENQQIKEESISQIQSGYYESVMNTRLFPILERRVDDSYRDVSGVGCKVLTGKNTHRPVSNVQDNGPENYSYEMVEGFQHMYTIFMENKQLLLGDESPLKVFKETHFRFNVRATSHYLSINNLCMVPEALKTGAEFCDRIHAIRVRIGSIFSRGLPLDMRLEELKILARLDVPRFTISPDSKRLAGDDGQLFDDVMKFSGMDLVEQRIRDLSELDKKQQVGYIKDSLVKC